MLYLLSIKFVGLMLLLYQSLKFYKNNWRIKNYLLNLKSVLKIMFINNYERFCLRFLYFLLVINSCIADRDSFIFDIWDTVF